MTNIQKFMFTTRFDRTGDLLPVEDKAEPPPPPPLTFTEEQFEKARAEAFAEGRRAGLAEGAATNERESASAMTAIGQRLQTIVRQQSEANEIAARDAVRVAMAVVRKVLPEAARRNALDEIQAVLAECVAQLAEDARIDIRVHGTLANELRDRLATLKPVAAGEITLDVTADDRLATGDCRVEWGSGGCERVAGRLWQDLDRIIERSLATEAGPVPARAADEFSGDETVTWGDRHGGQ